MATVYLAEDLKHDRLVALKVLHPELAASLGPERFLREIKVAARLNHPHILPLHDSGQAGDLLYYVMPYVEGESLRQRLTREKQLPVEDALQIARNVAMALDYAHRHQVVRRDIKPENVMLHEGEALVTDFGIAKAISVAGGESLTQTGMAVGTAAYMSPEQAAGEAEPEGRSDVYSLGCMLYEMLAGAAPFTGPTVQAVMARRFTEPVPSLRAVRPSVPEAVEQAGAKALARVPADRFATAAQFAQALVIYIGSTPPGVTIATQAAAPTAKSIAVLPFVDMSPQRDQEYFCKGMAEEIINALTKIQALRVASRSSAFAFQGPESGHPAGRRAGRRRHRARGQRAQGREQAPDHGAAHQRGRRLPRLVGALRSRHGGRLRDPGRDRPEYCASAAGDAERGREARHRAGAHRRREGVRLRVARSQLHGGQQNICGRVALTGRARGRAWTRAVLWPASAHRGTVGPKSRCSICGRYLEEGEHQDDHRHTHDLHPEE